MKITQIFTDATHSEARREIFPSARVPYATELALGSEHTSGFLGFGVAITPSSCYLLSKMEKNKRAELIKRIYSDEGLGLSTARISMGSCDYSAELYSYDDVDGDLTLEHFSVERDEAYVIPMIKEILEVRPDLHILASPWSPPAWMKTGGSLCGGYMRREYVEVYAEYFVKFIEAYRSHGIRIAAVTPQNEPETQQSAKMTACAWHPDTEAEFVIALKRRLAEHSLDVEIWLYDHNHDALGINRVIWQLGEHSELRGAVGGVAFHYYGGAIEETRRLRKLFPDLPIHMTEGGPRLYDHYDSDHSKWGIIISKQLGLGFSSFLGWNLLLDEMGWPNVGPFLCGGLVTENSVTGELTYSGQYSALAHIARYVTPDSVISPITVSETFGQRMSAYPKPLDAPVGVLIKNGEEECAVVVNPNNEKMQANLTVAGSLCYAELPADSISTFVSEKRP